MYIGHNGEGILIDAGRSAKQLERSLCDNDINIGQLCKVNINACNESKGIFLVEPLQIKHIKFIADGNITYITSK